MHTVYPYLPLPLRFFLPGLSPTVRRAAPLTGSLTITVIRHAITLHAIGTGGIAPMPPDPDGTLVILGMLSAVS